MFSYCTATCKKIFRDVRLNGNPPSLPIHTKTNYRQKRKPFIYWGSNKYSWYIYIVASGSLYIIFQRDLSAGLFGPRMMICVSKDQDCFNISIWVCMKRILKTEDLHCYGQTNLLTMKAKLKSQQDNLCSKSKGTLQTKVRKAYRKLFAFGELLDWNTFFAGGGVTDALLRRVTTQVAKANGGHKNVWEIMSRICTEMQ